MDRPDASSLPKRAEGQRPLGTESDGCQPSHLLGRNGAPRTCLAVPDCKGCPLHHGNRVWPVGNRYRAKIALVGEGPGREEDRRGAPFVGPSGQLLDWMLKKAGLFRSQLWITNAGLCMPRDIDVPELDLYIPKKKAMKESVKKCRSRLIEELSIVAPRVVIATGNEAIESITGERGIMSKHGSLIPVDLQFLVGKRAKMSPYERDWTYVIPMLHPAAVLRGMEKHVHAMIYILRKAARIAKQGPKLSDRGKHLLVSPYAPNPEETIEGLRKLVDRVIALGADIAFDVETPHHKEGARKAALTVFGFASAALNTGCAVTILVWNQGKQRYERGWTRAQFRRIWRILQKLVYSPLVKWAWNRSYDDTVTKRYFKKIGGVVRDGMHLHWMIQPDAPHGLAYTSQSYLDIPAWKAKFQALEANGASTHEDLLIYNSQDCLNTANVVEFMKPIAARAQGYERFDFLLDHQQVMSEMAQTAWLLGLPVCSKTWNRRFTQAEKRRVAYLNIMRKAVVGVENDFAQSVHEMKCERKKLSAQRNGKKYKAPKFESLTAEQFNPGSPDHAQWFLYDFCYLAPSVYTSGGTNEDEALKRPSTSYKHVLDHLKNPLIKAYVKYAEYKKICETLRSIKAHCDPSTLNKPFWRVHPSWRDVGQKGTRWSSKPNFQNLEKSLRKLLKAPPGYKWVGADAAQIEYRVAAVMSGLDELIAIFNQEPFDENDPKEAWKKYDGRYDAHSMVCEEIFKEEFTEAPKKMKGALRTLTKRVVYGLFYGAMPARVYAALREDRRVPTKLRASLELAKLEQIYDGFMDRFPAWTKWCKGEVQHAKRFGYQVIAPWGRRRWWPVKDLEENKLRNTPIQMCAGDICNLLFRQMSARIDEAGLDATFAIHGHDACYYLVKAEHAEAVKQIVDEEFVYWLKGKDGRKVLIHGQAAIGDTVADVG